MKKFLTVILALVLALGLSAPALAFTGDAPDEDADVVFDLTIELVDFEDSDNSFSAYQAFSAPASNRGYARNEIVCAIVSVSGPKNADLYDEGYRSLAFEGDGVTLKVLERVYSNIKVNDNANTGDVVGDGNGGNVAQPRGNQDDEIEIPIASGTFDKVDKAYTFAWAFFAKVTGDDAYLSATLSKGLVFTGTGTRTLDIDDDYIVTATGTEGTNQIFTVTDGASTPLNLFRITTGKNSASKALDIYLDGTVTGATAGWFTISREASTGDLIFSSTSVGGGYVTLTNSSDTISTLYSANHTGNNSTDANVKRAYNYLMSVYDNDFVDYFGMDYDNIGNKVDEDFFESITGSDDLYAEVEIAPWFTYVEVPPEVVVDPPKTGDVVSVLGFILIALAAAAVIVVKKVRA